MHASEVLLEEARSTPDACFTPGFVDGHITSADILKSHTNSAVERFYFEFRAKTCSRQILLSLSFPSHSRKHVTLHYIYMRAHADSNYVVRLNLSLCESGGESVTTR